MSDQAKHAIARLTVLYYFGRPHSLICDCPACRAWDECDKIEPSTFAELDELSGRKPEPVKVL